MFSTFQSKYAEAELLYHGSQTIREKALGPEHPELAEVLDNRASSLWQQVGIWLQLLWVHIYELSKFPDAPTLPHNDQLLLHGVL